MKTKATNDPEFDYKGCRRLILASALILALIILLISTCSCNILAENPINNDYQITYISKTLTGKNKYRVENKYDYWYFYSKKTYAIGDTITIKVNP